jgi:predicted small secreted protein
MSMSHTFRRAIALLFVAAFSLGVSACNTFDGMGKDLNDAGKALGLVSDDSSK